MVERFKLDEIVNTVQVGDALQLLKRMPDECIDFSMTSPPYWNLRDYHVSGQIGLETHPQAHIEKLVGVLRELRRVLKPTGSLYLNLGDTYCSGGNGKTVVSRNRHGVKKVSNDSAMIDSFAFSVVKWIRPKQLLMIPARIAISMQEDGWLLRNAIIWHKSNAMPSSVKDRLANTYEFVFHFVKQRKYFYDLDAIREPHKTITIRRVHAGMKLLAKTGKGITRRNKYWGTVESTRHGNAGMLAGRGWRELNPLGKNPGDAFTLESVSSDFWTLSTKPFAGAHFAVYPKELCIKPMKSSCPQFVCQKCGKPRERITEPATYIAAGSNNSLRRSRANDARVNPSFKERKIRIGGKTLGWTECHCHAQFLPGIVLDPFCGSGTTCVVAQELGRRYIGFDLNPEYVKMAVRRLSQRS